MATAKVIDKHASDKHVINKEVIGKVEAAGVGVKIVSPDGSVHVAVVGTLIHKGDQIISTNPEAHFQVKYTHLAEPVSYEGEFRVLADGSVISGTDAMDSVSNDKHLSDILKTATGETSHTAAGETSHTVAGETSHTVAGETSHRVAGETSHTATGDIFQTAAGEATMTQSSGYFPSDVVAETGVGADVFAESSIPTDEVAGSSIGTEAFTQSTILGLTVDQGNTSSSSSDINNNTLSVTGDSGTNTYIPVVPAPVVPALVASDDNITKVADYISTTDFINLGRATLSTINEEGTARFAEDIMKVEHDISNMHFSTLGNLFVPIIEHALTGFADDIKGVSNMDSSSLETVLISTAKDILTGFADDITKFANQISGMDSSGVETIIKAAQAGFADDITKTEDYIFSHLEAAPVARVELKDALAVFADDITKVADYHISTMDFSSLETASPSTIKDALVAFADDITNVVDHISSTDFHSFDTVLPFTIDDSMLLANDTDVNGDHLQVHLTDGILHASDGTPAGIVALNDHGDIVVIPGPNKFDSSINDVVHFNYSAVDEHGVQSAPATVNVDVSLGTVTGHEVAYNEQSSSEFITGTDDTTPVAFSDNILNVGSTLDLSHVSAINTIDLSADAKVTGSGTPSPLATITASDVISATDTDNHTLVIKSSDNNASDQVHVDTNSLHSIGTIAIDTHHYTSYVDNDEHAHLLVQVD